MTKSLEALFKLQTYKQRHGHDISGVRPVMIPDESGEWVCRHDAEHLAELLKQAQSRIAELETAPHHNGMMQLSNELAEMKRKCAELESRQLSVKLPELCMGVVQSGKAVMVPYSGGHWLNKTAVIEAIRAAGGIVEGSE